MRSFACLFLLVAACGGNAVDAVDAGVCSDAVVPFAKSSADRVLHFDLSLGCVAITFDDAISIDARGNIQTVLDTWAGIPGSKLCFGAPTLSTLDPDDPSERRIHFRPVDPSNPTANTTAVAYVNNTGVIVFNVVRFSSAQGGNVALLASLVGSALGLGYAPAGSDSVMAQPASLTKPTAHDRAAVVALYGGTCQF